MPRASLFREGYKKYSSSAVEEEEDYFLRSFIQSSYQEEVPSSRQEAGPLCISKTTDLNKTTNFLVILEQTIRQSACLVP